MNIKDISINLCATNQTHFNDGMYSLICVAVGKVFDNRDIILNCNLVNDIEFLCKVLGHECEHIILTEIFNHDVSVQYDHVYECSIPDTFKWDD